MAFSTYTDLSTAIGTWGTRTYSTSQTDEFILIAQDFINDKLGSQYRRETSTTLTTNSSGVATLPTDFLAMRSVRRDESSAETMISMPYDLLVTLNPDQTSGDPTNYAISGSSFYVGPLIVEDDFDIVYWAKLTALSSTNSTNWLITAKPSVYLFYCRAAQAMFEEEWQSAAAFKAAGDEALDDLVAQGTLAQFSSTEMVLEQVTP